MGPEVPEKSQRAPTADGRPFGSIRQCELGERPVVDGGAGTLPTRSPGPRILPGFSPEEPPVRGRAARCPCWPDGWQASFRVAVFLFSGAVMGVDVVVGCAVAVVVDARDAAESRLFLPRRRRGPSRGGGGGEAVVLGPPRAGTGRVGGDHSSAGETIFMAFGTSPRRPGSRCVACTATTEDPSGRGRYAALGKLASVRGKRHHA